MAAPLPLPLMASLPKSHFSCLVTSSHQEEGLFRKVLNRYLGCSCFFFHTYCVLITCFIVQPMGRLCDFSLPSVLKRKRTKVGRPQMAASGSMEPAFMPCSKLQSNLSASKDKEGLCALGTGEHF